MKKVFLLMVVSVLLVMTGFAQTPAGGSNTDQANIKGCLGGSEGNYTVAEDGTSQILKITTSSVDLKLHLGQDVSLIGHKTSGTASSGAADNSFAVTGLTMISEHCAATAAAPAASASTPATTVSPTPGTTVTAPAAAAAASTPAAPASPSSATASTPAADAAVPAATASPASATASTPAMDVAVPVAPVSPSPETVSTPAVEAAVPAANATHSTPPSVHARTRSATPTAAATAPAETVNPASDTVIPTTADAATPTAPASPSSETAGTPAAAPAVPTATQKGGSLWLMISLVVLVIALTTLAPFVIRWRKRKMLERTDAPNLSLTHEVSSDEVSSDHDEPEPRKAA
jgi:hypothetical protein